MNIVEVVLPETCVDEYEVCEQGGEDWAQCAHHNHQTANLQVLSPATATQMTLLLTKKNIYAAIY